MLHRRLVIAVATAAIAVAALLAGRSIGPRERPAAGGYAEELADVSASVKWLDAKAEAEPRSALAQSMAAGAHLERARLTGDYNDYAAAERMMDRAFAVAPRGAGPVLERAGLSFTLHRFDRIEADLRVAERALLFDDPSRAAVVGLRADLALQRGQDSTAIRGMTEALALHPSPQGWSRLARANWLAGDRASAAQCYATALSLDHGRRESPRAWIHLQLGLMALEAEDVEGALAEYRKADADFPGWWLIEEHIAEALMLQGYAEEAEARYRDLIRRTGNPEFMDALARIEREKGRESETRKWISRSERIYRDRLKRFPEATWGHALRHYLDLGDAGIALDLAEKNWKLRPSREAGALLESARRRAGS
ncbi:MAG: hypothetical protein AAB011_11515 [Candidatus Eisenbacteria bacterium]